MNVLDTMGSILLLDIHIYFYCIYSSLYIVGKRGKQTVAASLSQLTFSSSCSIPYDYFIPSSTIIHATDHTSRIYLKIHSITQAGWFVPADWQICGETNQTKTKSPCRPPPHLLPPRQLSHP